MDINLSKIKKVFFIGIGGIGISAIARMMLLEGKEVFGSDIGENQMTGELSKVGVKIYLGQKIELIPKDVNLIVYSIAIPKYDPKFFEELKNNFKILILSYPAILGIVTANKYTIAVAGTHGKTTTTAMIAKILIDAGRDPSVIVGSILKDSKSNLVVGKSELFVVEACEYERSFLNIKPKILVITNIEADHLDCYKDLADIKDAFDKFLSQSENKITEQDYKKYLEKVSKLSVPGEHNRMNAAVALAVADILKIPLNPARTTLAGFSGTWRRLELRGKTSQGTIVYDDYAHHPTEIKASIQGLRELYGEKKLTIVFQPHLYSRTKALFNDFAQSFKGADTVFILPIYFAREDPDSDISSEKLAEAIRKNDLTNLTPNPSPERRGVLAQAFPDFKSSEEAVNLGPNDIFVTMGAGEAYKVADRVFGML